MMRAQVVLRSAEPKKLMYKAVFEMNSVQKALEQGIVVIHPSSTTDVLTAREKISGSNSTTYECSGKLGTMMLTLVRLQPALMKVSCQSTAPNDTGKVSSRLGAITCSKRAGW